MKQKLTIEVEYEQGEKDWDQRPFSIKLNGKEVQYYEAVSALLKCSQPNLRVEG